MSDIQFVLSSETIYTHIGKQASSKLKPCIQLRCMTCLVSAFEMTSFVSHLQVVGLSYIKETFYRGITRIFTYIYNKVAWSKCALTKHVNFYSTLYVVVVVQFGF